MRITRVGVIQHMREIWGSVRSWGGGGGGGSSVWGTRVRTTQRLSEQRATANGERAAAP